MGSGSENRQAALTQERFHVQTSVFLVQRVCENRRRCVLTWCLVEARRKQGAMEVAADKTCFNNHVELFCFMGSERPSSVPGRCAHVHWGCACCDAPHVP
eukprot:1409052-Amphidinium_carterae.1